MLKSLTHHIARGIQQIARDRPSQTVRRSLAMQADPPQRFIRINVADTGGNLLIQKNALDAGSSGSDRADHCVLIELRVQQVARNVTHRGWKSSIIIVIHHCCEGQTAKGALIHKSQLTALVSERDPHAQMLLVHCVRRLHQQLTAHSQVAHDSMIIVEAKPQVLSAT